MKRIFDLLIAILASCIFLLPVVIIAGIVKLTSKGPVLYWSDRVGKDNVIFKMPKFRSMKIDTPVVATHLLTDPKQHLSPVGDVLRKTSLDELPQLWCILTGTMSVVGPRPALYNQFDLIQLRTERGVSELTPGLTGWAQINGRDELPIPEKVALDVVYLKQKSFLFDLEIIFKTIEKVILGANVKH